MSAIIQVIHEKAYNRVLFKIKNNDNHYCKIDFNDFDITDYNIGFDSKFILLAGGMQFIEDLVRNADGYIKENPSPNGEGFITYLKYDERQKKLNKLLKES